ncbi:MAG: hypothetical protein HY648_05275 [Acidobacteria bacterium]|nr:hypothetical protein [Acidobacteriota bacterium]
MGTVSKEREVISYMMLFCALIMVKKSKATVDEAAMLVTVGGKGKFLAQSLVALPA